MNLFLLSSRRSFHIHLSQWAVVVYDRRIIHFIVPNSILQMKSLIFPSRDDKIWIWPPWKLVRHHVVFFLHENLTSHPSESVGRYSDNWTLRCYQFPVFVHKFDINNQVVICEFGTSNKQLDSVTADNSVIKNNVFLLIYQSSDFFPIMRARKEVKGNSELT